MLSIFTKAWWCSGFIGAWPLAGILNLNCQITFLDMAGLLSFISTVVIYVSMLQKEKLIHQDIFEGYILISLILLQKSYVLLYDAGQKQTVLLFGSSCRKNHLFIEA